MEGFTQIENDVLESLIISNLSKSEIRVALCILRKLNGYHKEEDQISISQIMGMTGLSNRSVIDALKQLRLVKICSLVKKGVSRKSSSVYRFEKNVDRWQLVKRSSLVKFPTSTGEVSRKELVKISSHTKERTNKTTKEITTKVVRKKPSPEINELVKYYQKALGHSLDGTVKSNRQNCWNLVRKIKKEYPDKDAVGAIKSLIDVGLKDDFHSKNLTNFKYLYYNIQKIIKSYQGGAGKRKVHFIS